MSDETVIRPTEERKRKGDVVIVPLRDSENWHERPARVEQQTTLERYRARKTLEVWQLEAAERFHANTSRSNRFPRLTMSFTPPISGACPEMVDSQVSAGIARDRAISYMATVDETYPLIVEHVCVEDHAAESWAIKRGIHPMKGIRTLRKALDALCKHYGIKIGSAST